MFNRVVLATYNTFHAIAYPKAFQFLVGGFYSVNCLIMPKKFIVALHAVHPIDNGSTTI